MFRVQLPWECWKCSLGHAVSQNSLVVSHRLWTEKMSPNIEFLTFFTLFNVTLKGPEVLSFKESEMERETSSLGKWKNWNREARKCIYGSIEAGNSILLFSNSPPPTFIIFLVLGCILLVEIFFTLSLLQSGELHGTCGRDRILAILLSSRVTDGEIFYCIWCLSISEIQAQPLIHTKLSL